MLSMGALEEWLFVPTAVPTGGKDGIAAVGCGGGGETRWPWEST